MNLQMDPCQIDQETEGPLEDPLEEMMIIETILNIPQVEDHQEEDPLDSWEETLEENPLDKMDEMVEEVDLDHQVGTIMGRRWTTRKRQMRWRRQLCWMRWKKRSIWILWTWICCATSGCSSSISRKCDFGYYWIRDFI